MANPQSSERPDLQDLVAYMQGRGSETLRAQVLKRLDEDEEYLELMMDLVPMLREAGELADPDAAPASSPIRTFVDAPLPAVADAPPAGMPQMPGKVVALPRPASRPFGPIAALAAMIPIAVAIWVATRPQLPLPVSQAKLVGPVSELVLDNNDPWPATRGGAFGGCGDGACFDAGGQMIDLQIALDQRSQQRVRTRLSSLGVALGRDSFEEYFPALGDLPKEGPLDLDFIEKQVAAGYDNLRGQQDLLEGFEEGACLRAAWLAAEMKNAAYFESRKARKPCIEFVGENNWKPDASTLEELFYKTRGGFSDLP